MNYTKSYGCRDWARNSVQMYSRAFFSQKQLHGKKVPDMHELLYGIGKNWATDLSDQKKNGTFIIGDEINCSVLPNYQSISEVIDPLLRGKEKEDVTTETL